MKATFIFSNGRYLIIALCVSVLLSSCSVMLPLTATSNPVTANAKVGKAKATNVLGIWTDGDASIKAAATSGAITKIATVDTKVTTYLWLFKTIETTVTGE